MANLTVTLPEEEWVKALNMLVTFPFKDVAPTIQQMQQQLQMQVEQSKRQEQPMPKANGANVEAHAPGA